MITVTRQDRAVKCLAPQVKILKFSGQVILFVSWGREQGFAEILSSFAKEVKFCKGGDEYMRIFSVLEQLRPEVFVPTCDKLSRKAWQTNYRKTLQYMKQCPVVFLKNQVDICNWRGQLYVSLDIISTV